MGGIQGMVTFISASEGVLVRGMKTKLEESRIRVMFAGSDPEKIKRLQHETAVYIVFLGGNILSALRTADELMNEITQSMIVIGEAEEIQAMNRSMPELKANLILQRPVAPDDLQKEVVRLMERPTNGGIKHSLLILDDDPLYAKMVRGWLSATYKVSVVKTGVQALNFLAKNPVDLILLDYEMPVANGPQVFEMLRSQEETKYIPIVFLTSISTRESVSRVMNLKPEGYILKTSTRNQLTEWLKDFFEKQKAANEGDF